jgi:UDP-N-acetylglucosamine 2-epimerase (non-hydrolysing)
MPIIGVNSMSNQLKVLLVFGTRPEVIKMAPLVLEFKKYPEYFKCLVCVSGQHRQMINPLLKLFNIKVDYDLKIMKFNQGLDHITTTVLQKVGLILDKEKPDWVLVQGDTTTGMAASMAAFYKKIKIAHVEAGLRTGDKENPYPEESNRKIIDSMADVFFAHTLWAKNNLLREGIPSDRIVVTGNTVIDSLFHSIKQSFDFKSSSLAPLESEVRKIILVTAHRRENIGKSISNICSAIKKVALRHKDEVVFVYPVHLNPNVFKPVNESLRMVPNVLLIEPLEYLPFIHLMKRAHFLLTDSGGIQEEAPSLGKPVLVLRKTTERPEGVKAGCVEVVGTKQEEIYQSMERLLNNPQRYERMAKTRNPYGDGKASHRIVSWFKKHG